jgi:hypothetical protein
LEYPDISYNKLFRRVDLLRNLGVINPRKRGNKVLFSDEDISKVKRLIEIERSGIHRNKAVQMLIAEGEPAVAQTKEDERPSAEDLYEVVKKLQREGDAVSMALVTLYSHVAAYRSASLWKRLWWAIAPERSPLAESIRNIFKHS